MVEKVFKMTLGNENTVEKVVQDENIHYAHIIINKNEGTSEHYTNATTYMTVLRGTLSIKLGEQEVHEYTQGDILKIPFNTKMTATNLHEQTLELVVVKAPAPQA